MSNRLSAAILVLVLMLASLPGQALDGSFAPPSPNPMAVTNPGMNRYVDAPGLFSVLMRRTPDMSRQFLLARNMFRCVSEKDSGGIRSECRSRAALNSCFAFLTQR